MRHGDAPSVSESGVAKDAERPISAAGREHARRAAAYLSKQGIVPAVVLVSPLKRAQMTSREVAAVLKCPAPKTYAPLDNSMSGTDLVRKVMDDHGEKPVVLLIGHVPQVGESATYLTGQYFSIRPAGLVAIDTAGRKGKLLWTANPDEL